MIQPVQITEPTKPIEKSIEPTEPKEMTDKEKNLFTFAKAIETFEGWVENPPSRSFRNKNPGNLRGLTEYTKSLGATSVDDKNFCIFPSYEVGFNALKTLIKDTANDKLIGRRDVSVLEFFQGVKQEDGKFKFGCGDLLGYAPTEDDNAPIVYAMFVAKKVGCEIDTKLKDIV
jgi:hypothetical protein